MEFWDIWWLDRFGSTRRVFSSLIWTQFCCSYGEFSFVSALALAFVALLRLGGWTGVDQLPESLQSWFEVDPWYLDSLLKTWSESSTDDPLLLEVLHIAMQQFMLVTNFVFRTETFYTMKFWQNCSFCRSSQTIKKHRFRGVCMFGILKSSGVINDTATLFIW